MAEHIICFAAVAGVLVLRARSRFGHNAIDSGLQAHRTFILNPVIYCSISAFVVMNSATKHPEEGMLIILLNVLGIAVYKSGWWQRLVRVGTELG
jgi:hypothetical protein